MKRVVTVELNGMSFNFDEDAYDALRDYLRRAESQLANDPGRAEVLLDLERSIAEKCQAYLHAQKNVVNATEMAAVLAQIGVVEGYGEQDEHDWQSTTSDDTRPFVQIREGAMISGVCNGLAMRFGLDVTLVRVLFVVLAVLTSGAMVLVYIALMFVIPYDTNIEKVNDQSVPGFMFKLVKQTKRKFGAL